MPLADPHAALVVHRLPMPMLDPIALFAALPADMPAFLWIDGERRWCVAAGALDTHTAHGPDRLVALTAHADALRARLAPGVSPAELRLWTGFAFEDEAGDDPRWAAYPAAQLTLPAMWCTMEDGICRAHLISQAPARIAELPPSLGALARLDAWAQRALHHEPAPLAITPHDIAQLDHDHAHWATLVDETAARCAAPDSPLKKVVLARPIDLDTSVNPARTLRQLHADFPSCLTFAVRPASGAPVFLGATPEALARVESGRIYVDALAGSAPPSTSPSVLLDDPKERHEHALVVEAIREALDPLCARLNIPERPSIDRLTTITHLRTPIRGTLATPVHLLRLARRLHPTPAVCGAPRTAALDALTSAERRIRFARGWYAGALGWCDLEGEGHLHVALRSALVTPTTARVFVGAGIVAGSVGEREVIETRHKAAGTLRALHAVEVAS
jgi:isochorismate synthase